jgi:hypothetical protein
VPCSRHPENIEEQSNNRTGERNNMEQPNEENVTASSEFIELDANDLDQVTGGGLFDRILGTPTGLQADGHQIHKNTITGNSWLVDQNGKRVSEKFQMMPAYGGGFHIEDKKGNSLSQIPMRKPR